eukprot:TRINITY_DN958_c0_g1_i1.p1 TRINITY_DN958_c0_g1~~TRINITY_DN958_c0_g1_i1.p1  ORF type:complete len:193 (+),score=42.24 TRINITY_DN958_c0_g1_i1:116-694(+)
MATLTEQLSKDHYDIQTYFREFEKYYNDANWTEAKKWYNQLAWEIARHTVSEEVIVYPWLEKHTQFNVENCKRQNQRLKENFAQLEKLNVEDPNFHPLLTTTMDLVFQHTEHEEKELYPEVHRAGTSQELNFLAYRFEMRKMIAPTQPHPNAPSHPILQSLTGLLLAPLDKLSDMFKSWPTHEEVKTAVRTA